MTPITQEEARIALADVDRAEQQMLRAVARSPMGNNLIIAGVMWILGFTLNYLFPTHSRMIWLVLSASGLATMALLALMNHRRGEIRSPAAQRVLGQVGLFWAAVMGYLMALCIVLPLRNWVDEMTLIVTLLMLAYVLMGIWLRTGLLCFIGLAVTLATFVGRFCLPPREFMLWMAVFGGGGLFVPGLYVKLRWK